MAGAGKRRATSLLREVGQGESLQTFRTFSVVNTGISTSSVFIEAIGKAIKLLIYLFIY